MNISCISSAERIPTRGGRFLDYGCGSAQVVMEGRRRGLEFFGADTLYAAGDAGMDAALQVMRKKYPFKDEKVISTIWQYCHQDNQRE